MNKISYALGLSLGNNLKSSGVKSLVYERLSEAIQDVLEGKPLAMNAEDAQRELDAFFRDLQASLSRQAKEEGEAFLAENAKRPEVVTLPSGLQYEVLVAGKGALPKASDTVKVHYHGSFISGAVFDSSLRRGEPATFGVTQVIKGWVEALLLMPLGSKWKLFIPSDLAYGAQGAGASIPPHSALIFEVELLEII